MVKKATAFERTLGGRVKAYRTMRSLSQNELCDALEKRNLRVSRETVSKWEDGTRYLKPEYIVALAQVFDISCDELLTGRTKDGGVSKETCDACRVHWKAAVSAVLIASEGVQNETQPQA